jgi:DNA-binding transcriptional regulator YdaS (Cro superfamily)
MAALGQARRFRPKVNVSATPQFIGFVAPAIERSLSGVLLPSALKPVSGNSVPWADI